MNYHEFICMLIFAHFVGDYVFQSAWMSQAKKTNFWPMIVHCILYTCATGFIITKWKGELDWFIIWSLFISHWMIDKFRVYSEVSRKRVMLQRGLSKDAFWNLGVMLDQMLHSWILIAIMLYLKP